MRKLLCLMTVVGLGIGCARKDESASAGESLPVSNGNADRPVIEVRRNPVERSAPLVQVNLEIKPLHDRYERLFLQAVGFGIGRRLTMPVTQDEILAMKDESGWRKHRTGALAAFV